MNKIYLKELAIRIIKKFFLYLIDYGVFDVLKNKQVIDHTRVSIGVNCSVDKSALFLTSDGGKIILAGNNAIGRSVEIQPIKEGAIIIGEGTSIQDRNILIGDVEIGKGCLTAPNVYISSGRHYYDLIPEWYIKDQDKSVKTNITLYRNHSKKVVIHDDVWIGINSVIMRGVTIGKGSVIGANSVITKDVEPYSVMAGAPAKKIKNRIQLTKKSEIISFLDSDLPYFYRGFLLRQTEIKDSRNNGGIYTENKFTALLASKGDRIIMSIKNNTANTIILEYFHQKVNIGNDDFYIVEFNINPNTTYHEFSYSLSDFNNNNKSHCAIVKWIKIIS